MANNTAVELCRNDWIEQDLPKKDKKMFGNENNFKLFSDELKSDSKQVYSCHNNQTLKKVIHCSNILANHSCSESSLQCSPYVTKLMTDKGETPPNDIDYCSCNGDTANKVFLGSPMLLDGDYARSNLLNETKCIEISYPMQLMFVIKYNNNNNIDKTGRICVDRTTTSVIIKDSKPGNKKARMSEGEQMNLKFNNLADNIDIGCMLKRDDIPNGLIATRNMNYFAIGFGIAAQGQANTLGYQLQFFKPIQLQFYTNSRSNMNKIQSIDAVFRYQMGKYTELSLPIYKQAEQSFVPSYSIPQPMPQQSIQNNGLLFNNGNNGMNGSNNTETMSDLLPDSPVSVGLPSLYPIHVPPPIIPQPIQNDGFNRNNGNNIENNFVSMHQSSPQLYSMNINNINNNNNNGNSNIFDSSTVGDEINYPLMQQMQQIQHMQQMQHPMATDQLSINDCSLLDMTGMNNSNNNYYYEPARGMNNNFQHNRAEPYSTFTMANSSILPKLNDNINISASMETRINPIDQFQYSPLNSNNINNINDQFSSDNSSFNLNFDNRSVMSLGLNSNFDTNSLGMAMGTRFDNQSLFSNNFDFSN